MFLCEPRIASNLSRFTFTFPKPVPSDYSDKVLTSFLPTELKIDSFEDNFDFRY